MKRTVYMAAAMMALIVFVPGTAMAQAGQLVGALVSSLGVTKDQASGGAGLILGAVKAKAGKEEFKEVAKAVPDYEELIDKAPQASKEGSGGGLAAMMKQASPAMGQAMDLAKGFKLLGMDSSMIGPFVSVIVDYVKEKGYPVAAELVKSMISAP